MKMVKSLLLGTAAGLVAIAGAQAADLPVKAKAVEYVKVCSLYGAGFYYIPGTDVCLKVGGHVRMDVGFNSGNSLTLGPFNGPVAVASAPVAGLANGNNVASDHTWVQRNLYYASLDARSQTAYGAARAVLFVGNNSDWPAAVNAGTYNIRGFIQWAGFTMGQATSFFDFYPSPALQYAPWAWGSDTAASGWRVLAYTMNAGGGFSATISLEEPRRSAALGGLTYAAIRYPDIVGNVKIEQAWGSAQIMGALHDARAFVPAAGGAVYSGTGWAFGAGLILKADAVSRGDYFSVMATWSQGATRYASMFLPSVTGVGIFNAGGTPAAPDIYTVGYGSAVDSVVSGGVQYLTGAWSLQAAYEHFWRPDLKSNLFYNYIAFDYSNLIVGNATNQWDWSVWTLGSRTEWAVNKQLSLGFEVAYNALNTQFVNTTSLTGCLANNPGAPSPAGTSTCRNQGVWSGRIRAAYSF